MENVVENEEVWSLIPFSLSLSRDEEVETECEKEEEEPEGQDDNEKQSPSVEASRTVITLANYHANHPPLCHRLQVLLPLRSITTQLFIVCYRKLVVCPCGMPPSCIARRTHTNNSCPKVDTQTRQQVT